MPPPSGSERLNWLIHFIAQPSHIALGVVAYIVGLLLYRIVIRPRYISPLRNAPGPPVRNTLLGHFNDVIMREPGTALMGWAKEHGPVVRTVGPMGRERVLFLNSEALQKILVSDWTDYERPTILRDMLGLVAGYGLLTVTGNEHRQMRRAMNPAFSLPALMSQTEMYFDHIDVLTSIMRSQLADSKEGKVLHMYEWMSKVTLDIICATAFGYESNSLHNPHNPLAHAYETLLSLQSGPNMAKFMAVVSVPGVPALLNSRLGLALAPLFRCIYGFDTVSVLIESTYKIRQLSRGILRERMAESEGAVKGDSEIEGKKDILSLLIRARKGETKDGYQLSDDALVDQVLTFLGAGHETTATGLAWALYLLAKHPDVQNKLRAELAPVFAANPRPDYREMKDLKMLECVVMESLRVMPPVPLTLREAGKDDWIDGTFIPKGTLFYIPIRAVNTYEPIWGPDAHEFKPERWLELPSAYSPAFSLLSFIAGAHGCIGKTMAISEMKAVLAAMIANFEFSPSYEGQTAKPTAAITMKPEDNMPLLVKLVKHA
ncbi:cytochrome P450 [Peniophora sp. CONT]|nr:cytochrome P450 [Peniophora sp. CONT]